MSCFQIEEQNYCAMTAHKPFQNMDVEDELELKEVEKEEK
jgi:hypothetical protein